MQRKGAWTTTPWNVYVVPAATSVLLFYSVEERKDVSLPHPLQTPFNRVWHSVSAMSASSGQEDVYNQIFKFANDRNLKRFMDTTLRMK